MPPREAPGSRRVVVISSNSPMAEELDPLLQTHVKAVSFSRLKSYPTPQDFPGAIGGGAPHLVFLDVFSNRDQAVVLIEEMVKLGPQVQVIALLGENDPDRGLQSGVPM